MNKDVVEVASIMATTVLFSAGLYYVTLDLTTPTLPDQEQTPASVVVYDDDVQPISISPTQVVPISVTPITPTQLGGDSTDIQPITVEQPIVRRVQLGTPIPVVQIPITTVDTREIPTPAFPVPDAPQPVPPMVVKLSVVGEIPTGEVGVSNSILSDIQTRQLFRVGIETLIPDKRTHAYDPTLSMTNPNILKWIRIYNDDTPVAPVFIPLPPNIRIIAELRTSTYALQNLLFYKSKGYTACLISMTGTETVYELTELVRIVVSAGLKPWLANGGPERLTTTIYNDPDHIATLIASVAPYCEGYIGSWRRTSAHLIKQDMAYAGFFIRCVRQANPSIYLVGESYYGETATNTHDIPRSEWRSEDNAIPNQSGILVAGVGSVGYAIESLLSGVFAKWTDTARLGLILGAGPYYASRNNTNTTFADNLRIKQTLESRFTHAGCVGTVTLHGDGGDDGRSVMSTDDIGLFPIK